MAFKKGQSGNPNGRKPGAPNKITTETRLLFKMMCERMAPKVEAWIERTAKRDPGEAVSLVLRLAEFHIPKLQRVAIDLTKIPIEEIAAELERREAELDDGADSTNGSGLVQ